MDVDRRDESGRLGRTVPRLYGFAPDEPRDVRHMAVACPRGRSSAGARAAQRDAVVDDEGLMGTHVSDRAARRNGRRGCRVGDAPTATPTATSRGSPGSIWTSASTAGARRRSRRAVTRSTIARCGRCSRRRRRASCRWTRRGHRHSESRARSDVRLGAGELIGQSIERLLPSSLGTRTRAASADYFRRAAIRV